MLIFSFLLLPIAAASGWFMAHRNYQRETIAKKFTTVPKDYLVGLNFLLEEQPDKAVDVFIKMLEIDCETVETHLALGNLFRRRGEVERAIRIHQNLTARPDLDKYHRFQALLALGQDYMRAGVLDRAERIFLEIVANGCEQMVPSLRYLLNIYQQEKAWEKAINAARKMETAASISMQVNIAHYHCELAAEAWSNKNAEEAKKQLRRALAADPQCVRASLLYGEIEMSEQHYKLAIRFYKQVKSQNADYLSEILQPLITCYIAINDESALIEYLKECLPEFPRISLVLVLTDFMLHSEGIETALDFMTNYLRDNPSLKGLQRLIELQRLKETQESGKNLHLLADLTAAMLKNKPLYRCNQCGFNTKVLHWLCPQCKSWTTVKPIHSVENDN